MNGKVALVTGGSRGIGSGICRELAKVGATVAVNYTSNEQEAQRVAAEIREYGIKAKCFQANVGEKAAVDEMIQHIQAEFGKIDVLVNNAGICPFFDFFDIDEDTWQRTLDVNLSGMFYTSQAVGRMMRDQGGGAIVNISTVTTLRGGPQQVHYAASKGGVNSLTSSMAVALAPYHIRVNAILCGGVPTDINRTQFPYAPKAKSTLPAGRVGDPEDLGKAVVYLASDDSEWVTGTLLTVDGGSMVV